MSHMTPTDIARKRDMTLTPPPYKRCGTCRYRQFIYCAVAGDERRDLMRMINNHDSCDLWEDKSCES